MLITYKIRHTAFAVRKSLIPQRQFCQPKNACPSLMPAAIRSTLQYKLPQKKENYHNKLQFI
jgi:hypothetical protein